LSETESRYYHLYADGETVKEISQETYRIMCTEDFNRSNTRLLIAVYPKEIYVHKGNRGQFIPLMQLRKILGDL